MPSQYEAGRSVLSVAGAQALMPRVGLACGTITEMNIKKTKSHFHSCSQAAMDLSWFKLPDYRPILKNFGICCIHMVQMSQFAQLS
jgi:hypothetical protein